jgi:hypothetical protein
MAPSHRDAINLGGFPAINMVFDLKRSDTGHAATSGALRGPHRRCQLGRLA